MTTLPEPYLSAMSTNFILGPNVREALYTADQLTAYGAACAAAERERCAKLCEQADKSTHPSDLADAIRGEHD